MNFFAKFDERVRVQMMAKLDSDETRQYIAQQANKMVDQSIERQFGMMLDPSKNVRQPTAPRADSPIITYNQDVEGVPEVIEVPKNGHKGKVTK
jgi:hypothetical protein